MNGIVQPASVTVEALEHGDKVIIGFIQCNPMQ